MNFIKSKTQAEWTETYKSWWSSLRDLVSDDGEKSLLTGLVLGALLILLFKFIVVLLILLTFALLVIWVLAPSE